MYVNIVDSRSPLFSRCLGVSASGRPMAWFSTPPLFQNGGWETPPPLHVGAGRSVSWAGLLPRLPFAPCPADLPAVGSSGPAAGLEP